MDDLDEKVIRFDLFKNNFHYAFSQLDDQFKTNKNIKFFFDKNWNLIATVNNQSMYFLPGEGVWVKIL